MERLNRVYHNPVYQLLLGELKELEAGRISCRHEETHFLAVARLAWIRCMERKIPVEKELLYIAAFLHDIGKGRQYREQIPHEEASAEYAEQILREEGFSKEEISYVCGLIRSHRKLQGNEDELQQIFYQADKQSRACFCCPARNLCNWPEEKKNSLIGG